MKNVKLIKEDIWDGVMCSIVEGTTVGSDSVITAWLAQDMHYRPVKVIIETPKIRRYILVTLKKYNDYIYFPTSYSKTIYYADNPGEPKKKSSEHIYEIDNVNINIEIPDEEFSIEFPIGQRVHDFRIFQTIIYGFDHFHND